MTGPSVSGGVSWPELNSSWFAETSSPSTVADETNESETISSTTMGDGAHKAMNQGAQLAAHYQGNSTARSINVGSGSTITPSQQNKHILVNIKTIVEFKPLVQRVNATSTTSSPITNATTTTTTTTTTPSTTTSTTAKRSTFTTASRRYNHNYLPLDPARMKSILHEVRVSGDVRESGKTLTSVVCERIRQVRGYTVVL